MTDNKVSERTSLLKAKDEGPKGMKTKAAKRKGQKQKVEHMEEKKPEVPQGPTKRDIHYERQDIADKALISAVKTLAQLQRA